MMTVPILLCLLLLVTPALADLTLSDCDDASAWNGPVTVDTEHSKQGAGALRWHYGTAPIISPKTVPADWTSGNALSFWLCSEKPMLPEP